MIKGKYALPLIRTNLPTITCLDEHADRPVSGDADRLVSDDADRLVSDDTALDLAK